MKHSSPEIKDMDNLLSSVIQVSKSETTDNFETIVEKVMSGNTVVFAEGMGEAAILKTEKYTLRAIEEPDNEKVLTSLGVQQVTLPGTFRLQDIKDILIRMQYL
ncbi:MAG: spore germination protein [Oscillospiraceae bacterium]|jgi:co-chaperonin GroES (HSP10)